MCDARAIKTAKELHERTAHISRCADFARACWAIFEDKDLMRSLAHEVNAMRGMPWKTKNLKDRLYPSFHKEDYAEEHRKRSHIYYSIAENAERSKENGRAWRSIPENQLRIREKSRTHYEENREQELERARIRNAIPEVRARNKELRRAWREKNPSYNLQHHHKRHAIDPQYRLVRALRSRLYAAVKAGGVGKSASTMKLAGCTLPELMAHLESQFQPGMTWANQGLWHIDHIRPCASFDMTDPELSTPE